MKARRKKFIVIGVIAVVVLIIIGNLLSSGNSGTEVQAELSKMLDITEEVSASGIVQPQTRVNIVSEVTAEIIEIPVVDGQRVERGDLLVMLDRVQLQKDVDQSLYTLNEVEARTEASKASYRQAEEEYDRQKALFERDLTSEIAIKNAEYAYLNGKYNYEAMLSQTKQTRARYEKALDNLEKTRIVSPMDGIITYIDAEVGEIAPAQSAFTQGKTLMTVSNMSAFEVEVDVDETEIIKIRNGQQAKIEVDAFPDTVFAGEVVEIGNTAIVTGQGTQDQSTNFKVKVLFTESDEYIRPGMSATVDIITNTREKVITVPYGAIVMRSLDADSMAQAQDSGGLVSTAHAAQIDDTLPAGDDYEGDDEEKEKKDVKGVFVVEEGKARFIPVETGIADQKNIEITAGIAKGDTVITGPFRTLRSIKNGDTVTAEIKKKGKEQ